MKKNKLSVWTYPCRKRYYLTHPWKWWHDTYWNFRNWWHRGRYGFAYVDVWEWSNWWVQVGAAAMRYLAEHGHGYPGCEPWETPEKWRDHLLQTADKLDWCADSQDALYLEDKNEYSEQMDEIALRASKTEKDAEGMWHHWTELSGEEKEIRDKYFARFNELEEEYDKKRAEILKEIGEILPRYWD